MNSGTGGPVPSRNYWIKDSANCLTISPQCVRLRYRCRLWVNTNIKCITENLEWRHIAKSVWTPELAPTSIFWFRSLHLGMNLALVISGVQQLSSGGEAWLSVGVPEPAETSQMHQTGEKVSSWGWHKIGLTLLSKIITLYILMGDPRNQDKAEGKLYPVCLGPSSSPLTCYDRAHCVSMSNNGLDQYTLDRHVFETRWCN